MQEKKRRDVANKLDVLMPISYWPDFSAWTSGRLQTLPLVIILVVHACGAVWSCWRPQLGQAPPSNAAEITPAGLRADENEQCLPQSPSFRQWEHCEVSQRNWAPVVCTGMTLTPIPLTISPSSKQHALHACACGAFQISTVAQSCPTLCDPMDCPPQASLPITISWSLPKLMSIVSMMASNHLILCHLLLLPSIFCSIGVFSSESALCIRWPKHWSFSFTISPANEYSGLIFFRMHWLDLLAVQGPLQSLLQHHSSKASILWSGLWFPSPGEPLHLEADS